MNYKITHLMLVFGLLVLLLASVPLALAAPPQQDATATTTAGTPSPTVEGTVTTEPAATTAVTGTVEALATTQPVTTTAPAVATTVPPTTTAPANTLPATGGELSTASVIMIGILALSVILITTGLLLRGSSLLRR